ncbi:MAG: UDP-N-acetylmuramoyl-tripeptide--D-alanyl-D-alanine ligase, partial [Oscillospiraceae bacterium]|nr:UDP-N-acetylmuramoyl-tripeptide--D-alanyl-D-alanine ligase [Oscillospiraceae bacterium]
PTSLRVLMNGLTSSFVPDIVVDTVVTDSRQVIPGCVFVAIVGENFDGNDYAQQALKNGAAAAVVSRGEGEGMILVEDTKDALCAMAGNYRDQFHPLVVGVTGSVGKTTTKEMVAAIFNSFDKNTLKNFENRNNEIGLPETVFRMDDDTRLAILEMGMSSLGEISRLSRCGKPHAAIITYIGVSHREMLGTRENILRAKLEITDGMDRDGFLVINGDDPYLTGAIDTIPVPVVTFGVEDGDYDVAAREISCKGFPSEFTISDKKYGQFKAVIPCSGINNVQDALAAYALATRLGFDPARCAAALSDYEPAGMRQRFRKVRDITVIEDCYNAAPESMEAALRILSDLSCERLRIAVLGDMLELGAVSEEAHRRTGVLAGELGIDAVLCYGEMSKLTAEAAEEAGCPRVRHFDDKEELARYLLSISGAGDTVLFKGSRGMALEDIIRIFSREEN